MGKQNPYHRAELFALIEGSNPPQYIPVVVDSDGKLQTTGGGVDLVLRELFESEDDTAATVRDDYRSMESLEDQVGDGSVKTFTFSSDVHMVFVECVGGVGRATVDGAETPTATKGVYCDDGVPTPIVVIADVVKVFAPSDVTKIVVWGYRR